MKNRDNDTLNPPATTTRNDYSDDWQDHLRTNTRTGAEPHFNADRLQIPGLTILWHPNPYRIGECVAFSSMANATAVDLSRLSPRFSAPREGKPRPLADPHLSRRPIQFEQLDDGAIRINRGESSITVEANGVPLHEPTAFDSAEIQQGVVLLVAKRLVLLLHMMEPPVKRPEALGLIGESRGLLRVRREILKVADLQGPVLLTGESGTGKELVAHAIHQNGSRRDDPFFSINMGAIPPSLTASELFGAKKGSYSGANQDRPGFFQRADTGTLFLDEIGTTSPEAQVMLLRALETGEIQSVGAQKPQVVDVRVIAATDIDLDVSVASGQFKAPLFHRLASFEIALPPLRDRREDIGRLLFYFLQNELEQCGQHKLVDPGPYGKPWLPAELVSQLALYDWPGNVRQLRNVARQLVINSQGSPTALIDTRIEQLAQSAQPAPAPAAVVQAESPSNAAPAAPQASSYRQPWEVSEEELLTTLRESRWNLKRAADLLGISRASLYVLVDNNPKIRKASDLTRVEIEQSQLRCNGNLDAMVQDLEVSKRGLQLKMKELGMR